MFHVKPTKTGTTPTFIKPTHISQFQEKMFLHKISTMYQQTFYPTPQATNYFLYLHHEGEIYKHVVCKQTFFSPPGIILLIRAV